MNKNVHAWYLRLLHFPAFLSSLPLFHPFSSTPFFFSSSRRRIDCLRHPVPFCSSHYGRAAIEFPRVVFSGTIFNPVPWSEAESRVNRYDAAPPVDGPASISFREIVGRDKGEHWPMKRRRRSSCRSSIRDPNFSSILMELLFRYTW